ncbi:unnamed protein product [Mytilus coruscus]|uniref:NCAM n=1 Tax=Mytilus coruscus TaxID=42192 RepID=A0A6J8CEB9_MYTCO|nr:unnamed protein product [Mytilus coruscus]
MWDRKKFIFVFLKVLQVAGTIQEVLVRTGDTIVLNCTCTKLSNGLWNGPNKSASRIKDLDEEQLIPYSQGVLLNPKLNLSNYYIVGSYKNRTCNLMISNVSSNDEGKYHCQYVENDTTNSLFYRVLIQNPPDVSINTTHFEDRVYLDCYASGDSGNTFKDWEHKSESGKHIRYIENKQDGTLVLQKNNFQNSGIYICRVNNGIPDMNGRLYQNKQVLVHYEGPPVFISNNRKTWFVQCLGEVIVTLKVFTSSDITSGQIYKREEQNDERQSSEAVGSLMNSTYREHLVFYNVSVKVPFIEVTFNITKSMKDDSRNYSAKVCNTFGCNSFEVTVNSTGIPEPPSNISLISDETKILIKWYPGLNGGCSQHSFIEYRKISLKIWKNTGPIPNQMEKDNIFTLSDLRPDTQYEIRMYTRNKAGNSVKTNITTILTRKLIEDRQYFLLWIITSVIVILAVTCCGLVFVVVRKREKRRQCHNIRTSDLNMNIQGESVDNRLYLSSDFRQSHSTRNQPERYEMEIQPPGQSSSAFGSHYQEEFLEEQNVFHADQIIATQHTESNLNYAEVIFEAVPSTSANIIHGKEDRTIYSEIDLLCHADVIPSSSESDDDFMYVDGIENYNKQTCL